MDIDQYKKLAFKNNTFNLKAVEMSLEESKMNAYQYLRQFQLESTGYQRFDFKMQDIYRTNKVNHGWSYVPRRWLFYIDYEFIHVGKRLDYKRSELFEKDLSYDDIINNPDLFSSSFLVYIDGELFTEGIKILCKEEKTYVIFNCKEKPADNGFTISDMLRYLNDNVDVTIFFIPNVGITNISTNAYRLRNTAAYKGLQYRSLNFSEKATYDDKTLTYVKYKDSLASKPVNVNFGEIGLFVDENTVQKTIDENPDDTTMNIQVIPLRHIFQKVKLEVGDKWFKLPMQDYPIASDNCLVFDTEGTFIHKARIRHYYPNVYSVEDVDDVIAEKELIIYVFYYKNNQSILKHINIVEVYQKYMYDYLERYRDGKIPQILVDYEPPIVDYNIKDFRLFNLTDSHFVYKVEKMREFIRADVNNFRRYLRKLDVHNNYYYVDISKINLEERLRRDNSDTGLMPREFNEDHYMFIFRNDFRGMYDKLLIHVDGIRYETLELFATDKYDFVYIPCNIIKPDSILEIEKLTEVNKEIPFTADEAHVTIDIGEFAVRNKTLYNDLFVIDNETSMYLEPHQYRIVFPFEIEYNPEVINYIKSKDGSDYYYLDISSEGKVKLVQPDKSNIYYNAGYVVTEDDITNSIYQLNIDHSDVAYDLLDGDMEIAKKVNSIKDPNTSFLFNISDGKVSIEVMSDNIATINEDEVLPDVIELSNVFLRCNRFVTVIILDEALYGRQLSLCIKKNFKIAKKEIQEVEEDLSAIEFVADSKNDRRYFRLYRNGKLVPRHLGGVRFPFDCNVAEMVVYPGFHREIGDVITVEMMPYMMNQICYMTHIPNNKVIDLRGMIDKPFDFRWHDIYINGRKLVKSEVEIITANRIKILGSESLRWLEIIENSRDKEYFGYKPVYDFMDELFDFDQEFADRVNDSIKDMFDNEEPVVENPIPLIDYILKDFYDNYLVPKFGLINPDWLQIDRKTIKTYPELLSEDECFQLNPDFGKGELKLRINPDDE